MHIKHGCETKLHNPETYGSLCFQKGTATDSILCGEYIIQDRMMPMEPWAYLGLSYHVASMLATHRALFKMHTPDKPQLPAISVYLMVFCSRGANLAFKDIADKHIPNFLSAETWIFGENWN